MNRDEYRHRNEAGLYIGKHKSGSYCHPVDAQSGGTWAGVNSNGVSLCLLNRYQVATIDNATSRGTIIPTALQQGDLASILTFMRQLDVSPLNGFDCIVSTAHTSVQFSWDRLTYGEQRLTINNGMMFTSSSERLDEVSAYRHQLFEQWQSNSDNIDSFHLQQEEGQATNAVLMSRTPTHTKSMVQFQLTPTAYSLDYYENPSFMSNQTLADKKPCQSWLHPNT